jgi:hypothetical protein
LGEGIGGRCCVDFSVAAVQVPAAFAGSGVGNPGMERVLTHCDQPGQQLIQALISLIEPRLHPGRDHGIAIRD